MDVIFHRSLREADPAVAESLHEDVRRQQDNLVLIPSENYASPAVLEAQGSVMTNKYAEGYPGKRYYNGCEFVDAVESLAIGRAKQIFRADHANVQAHSGSQANVAVYHALLEPGDRILGMELTHGGHLSHGIPKNIAGTVYDAAFYGVEEDTGLVDLNRVRDIALSHKPRMIIVGGSAYPRTIDFAPWREIADEVGAYLLADIAHIAGLVAAGEHPDPVPYADAVSLTTHKTMRGPRGAVILCREEHADAIDRAIFPGLQGGPFMHAIAARAVNLHEVMQPQFAFYIRQVMTNARALADRLMGHGFELISGGTDTHLMLVDLTNRPFSGRRAADRLEEAGMIVNRNTIPFDKRSAYVTSGIRPGTPAVTTRGMGVEEMNVIGDFIAEAVKKKTGEAGRARIRADVAELCGRFPIYPNRTF